MIIMKLLAVVTPPYIYHHQRTCFKPIKVVGLNSREREKALELLIVLVKKKGGRIKAITCSNGSLKRSWIQKEYTSIPTDYL